MNSTFHRPVLLAEVVEILDPRRDGTYFDGTLGGGGHAGAILSASAPTGRLFATDRDPAALAAAADVLAPFAGRVHAELAGFDELDELDAFHGIEFDGAVLDLGVSSHQIDTPRRGFAFDADGPLDMRMGPEGPTAAEILNDLPAAELAELFRRYGEESAAAALARAVERARRVRRLATTAELKAVLRGALPAPANPVKVYARIFQALRIAVNDELDRLERGLRGVFRRLRPGGRLAVLAYHSLEDRPVKRYFQDLARACVCPPDLPVCGCGRTPEARILTRRAVVAGPAEILDNPRARSVRLRAVERLSAPEAARTHANR